MRRMGRVAQFPAQRGVSGGVLVLAVNVTQMLEQQGKRLLVDATAVSLDAVVGAGPELIQVPARLGYSNDRELKMAAPRYRMQSRKDLLVGQIAGRAEEGQGVRMWLAHAPLPFLFQMSAEFESHRRQQLVLELGV